MEKILITGATGNVGLATLRFFQNQNFPDVEIVAAVRDIERARNIPGIENCHFCHFEFDEPSTYEAALKGVTKIVLIRPNQVSDVNSYIFPFLAKAEKMGVKHLVFVSIIGADRSRILANHRTENHIRKMGIPYTILRPSLYMQNLANLHQHDIRDHDRIIIPGGNGQVNYVDVRDVAEAVATILMNPGHEAKEYEVTGPEALDFYQIAKIFSNELGREIHYTRPSAIYFVRQKLLNKKHLLYVLTLSVLYTSVRSGKMNYTNQVLESLIGHVPRRLGDFIHEFRECWIGSSVAKSVKKRRSFRRKLKKS